jgi:hypothetical protein
MGARIYDLNDPLDFCGVEQRERHGYAEAYCPGCGAWCRVGEDYKGERLVILTLQHVPICGHYESILKSNALRNK